MELLSSCKQKKIGSQGPRKQGRKKTTHTKTRRRPFFFLISLGWIYLLNLYLQSRFMASPWCTSLLRMNPSALSYLNPVIRQDLSTRERESLTLTGQVLPVGDFSVSCGQVVPTTSGVNQSRVDQVRFKCLSTPRRGPNNKSLAFVVPGAHSYELAGFLTPSDDGWLLFQVFSSSLFEPFFLHHQRSSGEHRRQRESGKARYVGSSP